MHTLPSRQQGVSLVVTLVLVVLLSLLALYGAGVLIMDTRSAANDYRAREALAAAEAGLDQGFSLLSVNRARISSAGFDVNDNGTIDAGEAWTACTATDSQCLPVRAADRTNWQYIAVSSSLVKRPWRDDDGDGVKDASEPYLGNFSLYFLTPQSSPPTPAANGVDPSGLVYNIVAIGTSADATSTATAKQGAYFYSLLLGEVDTPLAAASNVPLTGNFSIISNQKEVGSGSRTLTAWSNSTISTGGSFARCYKEEFSGGACPSDSDILDYVGTGTCDDDLCGNDPNFPTDLFDFLFGVAEAEYEKIKAQATVVTDCTGLSTTSSGIIWVTGDCNPSGIIGTEDEPVLLVVEGDTTFNAGDEIYGLLYLFDPAGSTPSLISNGNATMHGAIVAHDGATMNLTGGFVLEYDGTVLKNLSRNSASRVLTRLPGSWSDVQ